MVLIILLLTLTAVLGAFRVGNLNEALLGNTSDYSRAYSAAEALVRDAEIDIKGRRPPYSTVQGDGQIGFPCRPNPPSSTTTNLDEAGYESSCRLRFSTTTPWFPQNSEAFDLVGDIVAANDATRRCENAICMPLNTTSHANIEDSITSSTTADATANAATVTASNQWKALGATYGLYTRSSLTAPGVAGNPILNVTGGAARAWYWVEAFRYAEGVSSEGEIAGNLIPSGNANYVYRITAVAFGLKPGTKVVIKSIYVPFPKSQGG